MGADDRKRAVPYEQVMLANGSIQNTTMLQGLPPSAALNESPA